MSLLELEGKPFTTNNPGELTQYLKSVRKANPALTVDQAMKDHISPNHEISVVWSALRDAEFPVNEVREHFTGSSILPKDCSM